jgi:hypothetical protein
MKQKVRIHFENCAPISSKKRQNRMNTKTEGTLAILAALLVLFSAMWDPRISVIVSIAALVGLGIYKLLPQKR